MNINVLHIFNEHRQDVKRLPPASLRDRIMAQLIDGIILGTIVGVTLALFSNGYIFSLWLSPMIPVYLVQVNPGHIPNPADWWWGGHYLTVSLPIIAKLHFAYPAPTQWLIYGLYYGVFHTKYGQTPGKMMKGLVLLNETSEPPYFWISIKRWILYLVSLLPLGMGFWTSTFARDKKTWHDQLVGTGVYKFLDTE